MFCCSWPVGTSHTCGWPLQYQLMAKHCTAMKQYHDVQDTWDSIQTIIECRTPNFPGQRIAPSHTGGLRAPEGTRGLGAGGLRAPV